MDDRAVVVVDGDLVDARDLVDSQALEGGLEALVVAGGGLVDGLLLAVVRKVFFFLEKRERERW